jgi:simple sugar transport system permease protein
VAEVSETVQRSSDVAGAPSGEPPSGNGAWGRLRDVGIFLAKQREATVFVVVVLLVVYFGLINTTGRSVFFTKITLVSLTQTASPIIIIALGEVLLLICGEIDISVGFIFAYTPFIMHFLADYYSVPGILAIILALVFAAFIGFVNGFLTVTVGLPSFVTTLGTGFVIGGLLLTTAHGTQANVPAAVTGIAHWMGQDAWAEISWAIGLTILFQMLLRQTRWGLHTIAVGGNALAAAEAGVNVAKIKYGNFMLTAVLGGFVGMQEAFRTGVIDTFAGGAAYQPMFYAVAAAVIGGTAMLGGSGTIIGAFLGSFVLATLINGFNVTGVSAFPQQIFFGGAILLAMIANVQLARLRAQGRIR